jgi:RNA polymerase sigma factor (sigma-70 family)
MVRTEPLGENDGRMAALMERYCAGEAAAFHELYAAVGPRILGYLTGLVGDRATAEDLLQHTFMKLHEARSAYVRGANPVPWLYTIAHRTCLDEIRRRKRARVRLSTDGDLPYEPSVDITGAADPQPAVDEAAVSRGLAALATLSPPLRQAVLLTKIHGHSSAEAATIAGTTVSAIKVRAHRGFLALRQKLAAPTVETQAVGTP